MTCAPDWLQDFWDYATPERAVAVFTGVLAAGTLLLWWYTKRAANAAKAAAEHIPRVERAYLHIIIVNETISDAGISLASNQAALHGEGHVELRPSVRYKFKNYGKTPALLKEISRFVSQEVALPEEPQYIPVDTVTKERFVAAGDATEEWECSFPGPLSIQDAASINRAQRSFWFYGRVIYDDIFGTSHEHRFVWKWNAGSHGFRPIDHPQHSKNT